jgi:hypothetical protein
MPTKTTKAFKACFVVAVGRMKALRPMMLPIPVRS